MKKGIPCLIATLFFGFFFQACWSSKNSELPDTNYLSPKISFTSKWKRFTVKHPTGFWQVIKNERWTLLYNNQDAPVQMIVDAKRHFVNIPSREKRLKSFIKSVKARKSEILDQEEIVIAGAKAVKINIEVEILFDYWDAFSVTRYIEVNFFEKNNRSYLLAYSSDKKHFKKYYQNFSNIKENFTIITDQTQLDKPAPPD